MFKKFAGLTRKVVVTIIATLVALIGLVVPAAPANAVPVPSILALQTTHCGITAVWDYDGSEAYTGYKVQVWSKLTTVRGDDGSVTYYRRFCVRASKTVSSTKTLTVNLGMSASTTGTAIERSVLVEYGFKISVWTRLGSSTATKHYLTLFGV